ncbi:Gfo/Idh/MocA family protein [Microbulbifer hydrolyticus]|uniref:Dehydrogenase n=1 Tax=Microbulbifer hydrolyticus TaxID=48074 RepID=A0A6P1T3N7_9GAMM|nr:Gfo/Idh/MocA family oxidoreductase [Microbulbifer hydrolyticus]MBB5211717.1 putative dehydrogenase [Microbulbifer hydrolyticus]QHQ37554.1 Gfo/Idh/MocA family oxidoreductase [Microbulbifer hydrolyticus]
MKQVTDQINWGIIGCGNVTEVKSGPAFNKVAGSKLVAVMRRDKAKLRDYAARHAVPKVYESADELINDPEIDAIYVATPPGSHKEYALKVASANKHCCLEKPMALNFEECCEINAAFAGKQAQLFVAYYRRSLPRFRKVKEWLESGKIGAVRHINWSYCRSPSPADLSPDYDWHTDPVVSGGGHFVDLACHGLDLFMFLAGDIREAKGIAVNQQNLYDAEDAVSACWVFESGATGSGFWNFGASERVDQVVITGSAGNIRFSVFSDEPFVLESAAGSEVAEIGNPENIQYFHIENMVKHLNGEALHPAPGDKAARASLVMDQILAGFRRPT